ncbi:replication/maintenance protein RepL [Actinomadura kijaniata]|uniref:replication/maintenance protein RepL n=1 Tax=Actinomadura kijaniata TaxID=46161 RepID=UPI00082D6DEE|nr:replication/maintenance protein RepL [Actinomadura kijaniata]
MSTTRRSDLAIPPGHHLTVRRGKDGTEIVAVHKTTGFEFALLGDAKGFVLDAAALHECLGYLRLRPAWHQVWNALVALQSRRQTGYVKITYSELAERYGIAEGHISTAFTYFMELGWLRRVRNGLYQLNPWLSFRGTSSDQEVAQHEWVDAQQAWIEATGGFVCVLPDRPDHAREWLAAREQGTQLSLVELDDSGVPTVSGTATRRTPRRRGGRGATTSVPSPSPAPEMAVSATDTAFPHQTPSTASDIRRRLRAQPTVNARVLLAADLLREQGVRPTKGTVGRFLEEHGFRDNPDTIKSALRRARLQTGQNREAI